MKIADFMFDKIYDILFVINKFSEYLLTIINNFTNIYDIINIIVIFTNLRINL